MGISDFIAWFVSPAPPLLPSPLLVLMGMLGQIRNCCRDWERIFPKFYFYPQPRILGHCKPISEIIFPAKAFVHNIYLHVKYIFGKEVQQCRQLLLEEDHQVASSWAGQRSLPCIRTRGQGGLVIFTWGSFKISWFANFENSGWVNICSDVQNECKGDGEDIALWALYLLIHNRITLHVHHKCDEPTIYRALKAITALNLTSDRSRGQGFFIVV